MSALPSSDHAHGLSPGERSRSHTDLVVESPACDHLCATNRRANIRGHLRSQPSEPDLTYCLALGGRYWLLSCATKWAEISLKTRVVLNLQFFAKRK